MRFSTNGLIVKESNTGENDRIITVVTADRGLVRAFATGTRRIGSKNFSGTGLLCYSNLTFNQKKDTYKVQEATPIEVFFSLRSDIEKMALAQYFCELCLAIVPEEEPAEPYLKIVLNSLSFLADGKRDFYLLKAITELRMLTIAGYMPDLVACTDCGAFAEEDMFFDPYSGLLYCNAHRPERPGLQPLNGALLAALRHIMYADISKLYSFSLLGEGARALSGITEKFVTVQTERRYKTLEFLHSMGL